MYNLFLQSQLNKEGSHLKIFRDLVQLRQLPSFQWGTFSKVVVNEQVFSFIRRAFGHPVFLVVMNMSDKNTNVNLLKSSDIAPRAYVKYYIPGKVASEAAATVTDDVNLAEKYKLDAPVLTKNVFLKARDCLILFWRSSD
jgi:hypothetical protein